MKKFLLVVFILLALIVGLFFAFVGRFLDNESYKKKLHQIADIYNVSVEWLKGETDIKEKPATETGDGRDEKTRILLELFSQADEQRRQEMINYAQYLLNQQNNNN